MNSGGFVRKSGWFWLLAVALFEVPCHALSIVAGPYLQNPGETSMTAMWITDGRCVSWVEYGEGEALDRKAYHSRHGLIDADGTIHRVAIEGLAAGREYRYRVCSKEIVDFKAYNVTYGETVTGDVQRFTTLSREKDSISVIVLNDIHQNDALLESLLNMSASRPYDVVFLNGDILGHLEDEAQVVGHVLRPCSEMFAKNVPMVWVRGNHETRGKFARMLPDYVATPEGKFYYSFDHGPVRFVVMDGGEDKEDGSVEYSGLAAFDTYRAEQRAWLEREIRTEAYRKAAFRVVVVHIPPMASERWHGPDDMYKTWTPVFNEGGVDLMICGHLHSYRVLEPGDGREFPIVIGGGPTKGAATVIRVDATAQALEAAIVRDDGEVVGKYRVDGERVGSSR